MMAAKKMLQDKLNTTITPIKNIKDITDKSTTSKSKTTCGITSEKYDVLKRHDC